MAPQTPTWQPLSALPMIAAHIDAWRAENDEQYHTLLAAADRPHIFDDTLIQRLDGVYTDQAGDIGLFAEPLDRWSQEPLSSPQRREIARLRVQLQHISQRTAEILAFAAPPKTTLSKKSSPKATLNWRWTCSPASSSSELPNRLR